MQGRSALRGWSVANTKELIGSGILSLWVRDIFLAPHFFSKYDFCASFGPSTALVFSESALFLLGEVGTAVQFSPLEEGAMSGLTHALAASPWYSQEGSLEADTPTEAP